MEQQQQQQHQQSPAHIAVSLCIISYFYGIKIQSHKNARRRIGKLEGKFDHHLELEIFLHH